MVGLPDLARDALAQLERSRPCRSTTAREFLAFGQPAGLTPRLDDHVNDAETALPAVDDADLLPPMNCRQLTLDFRPSPRSDRAQRQPDATAMRNQARSWAAHRSASAACGTQSWEDDLIMTGVRSFDVKAYDNSLAATPTWAGATTCALYACRTRSYSVHHERYCDDPDRRSRLLYWQPGRSGHHAVYPPVDGQQPRLRLHQLHLRARRADPAPD